jgi:histidinol dehydrogenase
MKIYRYPSAEAQERLAAIVDRQTAFQKKEITAVEKILKTVKKGGDAAVIDYVQRFDAPDLQIDQLKVTPEEFAEAKGQVDRAFMRALNRAKRQIGVFHERQKSNSWIVNERPGTLLGQLVRPVAAAGVYVPGSRGGKTPLVSSVLMGVIPAKIAGVSQVVMCTPPRTDGSVAPELLVAARKASVDAVYKLGSAWAIAAMAFGTKTVSKVDVIVGPGNIYVTLAKKLVAGMVAIDMIAGPSEILVIADESADAACVAADLLSQAEHDPLSSSVLVTTSETLARRVEQALAEQLASLSRRAIAKQSLARFGALMVVPDLNTAIAIANQVAPEHLELQVTDAMDYVGLIENAGAIFVGPYTPEPVGDYVAGPNHVLPTAGTARFSSALSVDHFVKKTSLVRYNREALKKEAKDIIRLAEVEGLGAHALAVKLRLDRP